MAEYAKAIAGDDKVPAWHFRYGEMLAQKNASADAAKHLGIADKGQGAMFGWREKDDPQKEHVTSWSVFSNTADYFDPKQPVMINYLVDDMDALLDRLEKEFQRMRARAGEKK